MDRPEKIIWGFVIAGIVAVWIVSMAYPAENMRYNNYEQRWEFAGEDDKLKYNHYKDDWSYQPEGSVLDYNVYERRMEWRRKGEKDGQ